MNEKQTHELTLRMTALDTVIQMASAGLIEQAVNVEEALESADKVKEWLAAGGDVSNVVELTRVQ